MFKSLLSFGGDSGHNKPTTDPGVKHGEEGDGEAAGSTSGWGSLVFGVTSNIATIATKIKTSMEEAPIMKDFTAQQDEFVKEKRQAGGSDGVPPWVGYIQEDQIKAQILALSTDKRNFITGPPQGSAFHFNFARYAPIAMATLNEDKSLEQMRFALVPSQVNEENFWRNYFYRVALIKRSSQLSAVSTSSRDSPHSHAVGTHSGRDSASDVGGESTTQPTLDGVSGSATGGNNSVTSSLGNIGLSSASADGTRSSSLEGISETKRAGSADAFKPIEYNPEDDDDNALSRGRGSVDGIEFASDSLEEQVLSGGRDVPVSVARETAAAASSIQSSKSALDVNAWEKELREDMLDLDISAALDTELAEYSLPDEPLSEMSWETEVRDALEDQ
eukprot:Opistho-2@28354